MKEYRTKPETKDLIIEGYRGSIAHGVHMGCGSIDDIDIFGIFIPGKEYVLGNKTWEIHERFENEYDYLYYSIKKFFRLAVKGNPNVITFLWNDPKDIFFKTPIGEQLLANRKIFIGKHIFSSFMGYAKGQLHRMEHHDIINKIDQEIRRRGL